MIILAPYWNHPRSIFVFGKELLNWEFIQTTLKGVSLQ